MRGRGRRSRLSGGSHEHPNVATLEALLQAPGARVLLRGGSIVTLDNSIGDLERGDVLIQGGKIRAIHADLSSSVADGQGITVDMDGMILVPGFVDAHRHCWQSQFRRMITDASIDEYMTLLHGELAPRYLPNDIYIGTIVSLLSALNSGTTTVLDFSHNSRTPAYSDAAFRAYAAVGTRVVHAYSTPSTGEWAEQWPDDAIRLREEYCHRRDLLATIRIGMYSPQRERFGAGIRYARDNEFEVTIDGIVGAAQAERVVDLGSKGLLGEDVTLVHCTDMSSLGWAAIRESGTYLTLATTSDQQLGLGSGVPPIEAALRNCIVPSLSTDVEVSLAGDMFTQMRCTLALQRMQTYRGRYFGEKSTSALLSNRDILICATRAGAYSVGLGNAIGTLSPGKSADILAVRANDINNIPYNDPIATIVQATDSSTIDTVFVEGAVKKWGGRLVAMDIAALRTMACESRDRLLARDCRGQIREHEFPKPTSEFPHLAAFLGEVSHS